MQPQVEAHSDDQDWPPSTVTRGAKETFADAGLVIMTNKTVPEGELHQPEEVPEVAIARAVAALAVTAVPAPTAAIPAAESSQPDGQLAEVQRVRQFFPETWLWTDLVTDDSGRATVTAEAPDRHHDLDVQGRLALQRARAGDCRGGASSVPAVLSPGGPAILRRYVARRYLSRSRCTTTSIRRRSSP